MRKNNKTDDRPDKNPIKKIAEEEKAKTEAVSPKEKDDDKEKSEEDNKIIERHGASYILEDGSLVEMLYDSKKHKSKLAVYKDGVVALEDEVQIDELTTFLPMSPNQSILENDFILFPSAVGEYQSNEELYYEIRAFIGRYVELREEFLSVVAVYTMMTWLYDRFQNIPYLRCVGMFGTGKSRLLSAAGHICYKAVLAGGSTSTAALFRTLDLFNPTLVFDEAELSEKESVEMRQVLRQGYSAGLPVSRMDKGLDGRLYIQTFDVFGPKIIASQSGFGDSALESRCLTERLFPLAKTLKPIQLSGQFKEEAQLLRNKLIMFRFKNYYLTVADEQALESIGLPRVKQTGLAMVSVAKMLGSQALDNVLKFLVESEKTLSKEQIDSAEHDILLCILELMEEKHIKATGKIRIGYDLAELFNRKHYEEYSDRKNNESHSSYSVMKYSAYKVSPKKIGWYVRKMGLTVDQDREGVFIPIFTEYPKVRALAERYGLGELYKLPDDPFKVQEIEDPNRIKKIRVKKEKEKKIEHKPLSDEAFKEIFGDDDIETKVESDNKNESVKEIIEIKPSDKNQESLETWEQDDGDTKS